MLRRWLKTFRRTRVAQDLDGFRWMLPPATLEDPTAWDTYWRDQMTHGVAGFVDLFCDDGPLVDAMRVNGFRSILCIGTGVSLEPRALAAAGFDVTALDLSPFAIGTAQQATAPPRHLERLIGGRAQQDGGQLNFVVGDLCDRTVCPGPFDVIIERRTLQLFARKHPEGLEAVASRLAARGILFSHSHDGAWRPPAPPRHACEDWFTARGWHHWYGQGRVSGRVVWLVVTTG
jgi:hypothetical protein